MLRAQPARTQRILVIGAGMAGLSTAFELVAQGYDVTVLEARTRPGGRVQTMRDPFPDGLYADAGAMQVYDSHLRAQRYIQQFGLELDPIRPAAPGSFFTVMGKPVESADSRAAFAKYVVPRLAAVHEADVQGALLARFGEYDRMTFADYVRSQGGSTFEVAVLNTGLPLGLGDGGEQHSALNLLREAAYRQLRKQSYTIRGGTDRLPKALAARLVDRVQYGTPVVRIEQDATSVRAVAAARGTTRTFTADRVVCALPFAVLRHIAVSPPLSPEKRTVVDRLENTSVAKVFILSRTRFWIAEGQSGGGASDDPPMLVSERSINQPGTRGILEAYLTGPAARRFCAVPEADRLNGVVANLAKFLPKIAEQHEGGTGKCWDDDEWARGAYAWFRPGQMSAFLPHIARPEGRIHFAGDHTSPTPGWMEGALSSAERVVEEIRRSG
jgi:monoamine oxidase